MKGIAFDLDNTLYDRYATIGGFISRDWERVKKYINPAYSLEAALDHLFHTESVYVHNGDWPGVYDALLKESFFNADNIPPYDKVADFARHGFETVGINFDGIHEFLQELKNRGYKLAVLTNAALTDYQNRKFDLLGIRQYFDEVVISGEYSTMMCGEPKNSDYCKPNASIFLYTAQKLGLDPSELYYVGDNPRCDILGAINGGYTPIWVRSRSPWSIDNKYMPELIVDNVIDILDIV